MHALKDKIAVITGGNSGIGLATAQRFIEQGARVALFGRDAETLARAAEVLGPNALAVQGDVTHLEDLQRLYQQTQARFGGRIDVLFANAGVAEFLPLEAVDNAHFTRQFDINVKGVLATVQQALPHLASPASVILTSSGVNKIGLPGTSVYSATKAAVRSFARTLSAELLPRGIRVNAVSPGLTATPIHGRTGLSAEQSEQLAAQLIAGIPMGRMAEAREIADTVLFLASDASRYLAGVEIDVDGGQTAI